MSEILKPLMLDETGKAIVEALTQQEMIQQRISEINTASDTAKQEISALTDSSKQSIETKTDEQVARIPEVTALATDVSSLKGDLGYKYIDVTGELIEGSFVSIETGSFTPLAGVKRTEYITIEERTEYFYTGTTYYLAGVSGYDEYKNYVCGILGDKDTSISYTNKKLSIPSDVKYIAASSSGGISIMSKSSNFKEVYGKIDEIESDLKNTHNSVTGLKDDNISSHEVTVETSTKHLGENPLMFRYQVSLRALESIKLLRMRMPLCSSLESDEVIVTLKDSATDNCTVFAEKTFSISNNRDQFYDFDMGLIVAKGETLVLSVATVSGEKTLYYHNNSTTDSEIGSIALENGTYDEDTNLTNQIVRYVGYITYLESVKLDLESVKLDLKGVRSDLEGLVITTDKIEDESITPGKLKTLFKSALCYDLKKCTPGKNLLDPKKLLKGTWAFDTSSDNITSGRAENYGSYILPANENGYIASTSCGAYGVISWIAYDKNFKEIRRLAGSQNTPELKQYIYEDGDAWVAFCFRIQPSMGIVEGTEYTYEPYYDDGEVNELQRKVEVIEGKVGLSMGPVEFIQTSPIYTVLNDKNINRNYVANVWIDHLMKQQSWFDKRIGFTEAMNKMTPFISPRDADMTQSYVEKTVTPVVVSSNFEAPAISIQHRCVKASASSNKFPKTLVIGDSVTGGYLASTNKPSADLPNQYWSWVRYFFELDRKDEGGASDKNNCLMIGITSIGGNEYGVQDSFSLDGKTYKSYAVGKGGWSAEDLNLPIFESETNVNPFYDETTQKFSLKTAVDKYKTLADDGITRLVVGETAGTEVTDVNAFDFCTPTHVVINLNHNSSLTEYESTIPEIVRTIKTEYPDMIVILMSIDEVGTYFPSFYPEYDSNVIKIGSLHDKNTQIYEYIRENLENEANGIYVCSGNLVQHPVASYPTIDYIYPDFIADDSKRFGTLSSGGGPNWHPNNRAHSVWGYQLYSLIKWTLTDK